MKGGETVKDLVRHGDLLFVPGPRPQEGDGKVLRATTSKVIEKGEVTGHAHRLGEAGAILEYVRPTWRSGEMEVMGRFVEVSEPTPVTHEEHGTVELRPLEPGFLYHVHRAREFDYVQVAPRRVRD